MEIIDNFLGKKQFEIIQQVIMGVHFEWYYNKHSNYTGDNTSQLTHHFYNYDSYGQSNSPSLPLLKPILEKLKVTGIVKINANLHYPDTSEQRIHTDFKFKNLITSVYYINTNNGGTKIKDKFVNSIENRMVIFPCSTPHSVVRHNNPSIGRFVINFNYYSDR